MERTGEEENRRNDIATAKRSSHFARLEEIVLELSCSKEKIEEEYKPNNEIDGNGFAKRLLARHDDEGTGMINRWIWMAHRVLLLIFGILGNIASGITFAAPIPTFVQIYKGKSVFEYRPLPYFVSFLSQMVWLYYGYLMPQGGLFIMVVSIIGCVFQMAYIVIYIRYATAELQRHAFWLVTIDLGIFSVIFLISYFVAGSILYRQLIVGCSCVIITITSFASPLVTVWRVIQTKSVEFMPLSLSAALVLNAGMWMAYGFASDDIYIQIPNILGIALGVMQIIIYGYYRYCYDVFHISAYFWQIFSFRV